MGDQLLGKRVEDRYNRRRRHASLGQVSPINLEMRCLAYTAAIKKAALPTLNGVKVTPTVFVKDLRQQLYAARRLCSIGSQGQFGNGAGTRRCVQRVARICCIYLGISANVGYLFDPLGG